MKAYAKALLAGLAVGISTAIPLVDDGLLLSEALTIVGAALAAGVLVWRVPNVPPEPT